MMSGFLKGLFFLDELWCGQTQVPASQLLALMGNGDEARKLAWLRIKTALSLAVELLGYFLITFGLAYGQPIGYFAMGVLFRVVGNLSGGLFLNRSGTLWASSLQTQLLNLKSYEQEIGAYLINQGGSEVEAHAISTLPSDLYQTEMICFQRAQWFHLGKAIVCGAALGLMGEIFSACLVSFLGIVAFPIGEYFFKVHTFRNEARLRIGRSANSIPFIQETYKDALSLSLKVNALSQFPILLFGIKFVSNSSTHLLAMLFAYTQGLTGLVGTIAFQRSRLVATRTTEIARHLIEALTSPTFLITQARWLEHCSQKPLPLPKELNQKIENGFALREFIVSLPLTRNGETYLLKPMTFAVPRGGIGLIQAPSGFGKSTLFLALSHLMNHKGDMYFIENGEWINIHKFSREELSKKIFFFRENNIESNARLTDLFKDVAKSKLASFYIPMTRQFGPFLTDLAWNAADNLLEREIINLKAKKRSAFPLIMEEALGEMRHERQKLLGEVLQNCQGNLFNSRIYPERLFYTLSTGEKKRMATLLALERASSCPEIELVILDEPFSNLDRDNLEEQITLIQRIQNLQVPPAQLLVSHHFIETMSSRLTNLQYIPINK